MCWSWFKGLRVTLYPFLSCLLCTEINPEYERLTVLRQIRETLVLVSDAWLPLIGDMA